MGKYCNRSRGKRDFKESSCKDYGKFSKYLENDLTNFDEILYGDHKKGYIKFLVKLYFKVLLYSRIR